MKIIAAAFLLFATVAMADIPKIAPADAAKLVADDKAVLVDVREPKEWAETGVAASAKLLPKSDFDGPKTQWKEFLAGVGDRKIIVYCRSGRRSELVGAELAKEGYKTLNAGGFAEWQKAGLPTRKIEKP
jgi:rhodanese-related sulfurtransferase